MQIYAEFFLIVYSAFPLLYIADHYFLFFGKLLHLYVLLPSQNPRRNIHYSSFKEENCSLANLAF